MSVAEATEPTPIDRYLAEQADLTAVERFARRHDADLLPSNARYYQDLIPLQRPQPGQQYGFEVDLDACTGCKACVTACHSLNGLDDDESWRTVGLLHGGTPTAPWQQTVTTACHHCVDPACLNGCPVNAYEKDPVTGIVVHLDDQCIGCGYCTLTCPYEVPRLNPSRGIVRKCDMCRGRLDAGEAPACVQACPNGAIKIAIVETATLAAEAAGDDRRLVPGAPPSSVTVPTTVYRTRRPGIADMQAADHFSLHPTREHRPLAVMLVLTQLAVGALAADLGIGRDHGGPAAVVAALAAVLGLAASVSHLGRPRYAFRAVLGFRHSWLSREIVAFGAFAGLTVLYAAGVRVSDSRVVVAIGVLALAAGIAGVGCSVMIYAVTSRTWWRARVTAPKFLLTATTGGLACIVAAEPETAPALMALAIIQLTAEASVFRHLRDAEATDGKRTALLLRGDLATQTRHRFVLGLAGGVALPPLVAASTGGWAVVWGALTVALLVAGALIERNQFFTAVTAPRMPGGLG